MPHQLFETLTIGQIVSNGQRRARIDNWVDYQQACTRRVNMLQGDWKLELRNFARKRVSTTVKSISYWKEVLSKSYFFDTSLNVMTDIIAKVADLYIESPRREWVINDQKDERFDELHTQLAPLLNYTMQESLKKSLACGGNLIRPVITDDGRWIFHIFTPDSFVPRASQTEPDTIIEVMYALHSRDSILQTHSTHVHISIDPDDPTAPFERITDEHGIDKLDVNGEKLTREGNEYLWFDDSGKPFIPLVTARLNNESTEIFNRAMGEDLEDSTLRAAWVNIQKEWNLKLQSHKQIVFTGDDAKLMDNKILDPLVPLILSAGDEGESNVTTLDLQSDLEKHFKEIEDIFSRQAGKWGFSLSDFIPTAQRQSGSALEIQNRQKSKARQNLINDWRRTENELIWTIIRIHNVTQKELMNRDLINEDGRAVIKFHKSAEITVDDVNKSVILKENDLTNSVKLIQEFNPNLSESEAESEFELNKSLNESSGETQGEKDNGGQTRN